MQGGAHRLPAPQAVLVVELVPLFIYSRRPRARWLPGAAGRGGAVEEQTPGAPQLRRKFGRAEPGRRPTRPEPGTKRPTRGPPAGIFRCGRPAGPRARFAGFIYCHSSPSKIPPNAGPKKRAAPDPTAQVCEPAMPTDEVDEVQIASFITIAGIAFSKYKNALFGAVHLAAIVAYMVRNNMCANAAIAAFWADIGLDPKKEIKKKSKDKVRFPTDQWLFRLFGSMSPEQLEERCDLMLDAQMKVARGAGIMTEAVIDIIDIHNIAHYGKLKSKHVIRTKSKDGASKAESYATVLTTSGDYPYCTAATRVVDKRTKGDIVSKLLDDRARRGIRAVLTLLDRGFFTVAVMKAFARRRQLFVMGATRTAAVKRAVDEYIL